MSNNIYFQTQGWDIGIGAVKERTASWDDFRRVSEIKRNVARGAWMDYLRSFAVNILDEEGWKKIYNRRYPWTTKANVMRRIIFMVAQIYARPAKRRYVIKKSDGKTEADPVYDGILQDRKINTKINRIMHQVDWIVESCGGCLVRPIDRGNGQWYFRVITPELISSIETDPEFPDEILVLEYLVASPDSTENESTFVTHRWSIKDDYGYFAVLDDNGKELEVIEGDKYPYKDGDSNPVLPFARFRYGQDEGELFDRMRGTDLLYATLETGFMHVLKAWTLIQSRKQIIVSGQEAEKIHEYPGDQAYPWVFPLDKAEFLVEMLDLIDDGERFESHVDSILEGVAGERGLSKEDFKATAQVRSAKSMQIQNEGRMAYMSAKQEAYREGEEELANIMRIENNAFNTEQIDWDARFEIDFSDLLAGDPMENFAEYEKLLGLNLISLPKFAIKFNPDLPSDEAATEYILNNQKVNQELSGIAAATGEVAQNAPPPNEGTVELPTEEEELNA